MDALSTVGAVEAGLLCAKCKYASNQVVGNTLYLPGSGKKQLET